MHSWPKNWRQPRVVASAEAHFANSKEGQAGSPVHPSSALGDKGIPSRFLPIRLLCYFPLPAWPQRAIIWHRCSNAYLGEVPLPLGKIQLGYLQPWWRRILFEWKSSRDNAVWGAETFHDSPSHTIRLRAWRPLSLPSNTCDLWRKLHAHLSSSLRHFVFWTPPEDRWCFVWRRQQKTLSSLSYQIWTPFFSGKASSKYLVWHSTWKNSSSRSLSTSQSIGVSPNYRSGGFGSSTCKEVL